MSMRPKEEKKETKEQLIKRAKEKRTQREVKNKERSMRKRQVKECNLFYPQRFRRETEQATRIQSLYRSYAIRKLLRAKLRQEIDHSMSQWKPGRPLEAEQLSGILQRIGLAFDVDLDKERLFKACQMCVQESAAVRNWRYRVTRLMQHCLTVFSKARPADNINPGLRFFEVFADSDWYPEMLR